MTTASDLFERIKQALAKRRGYADFFAWDDKQVAEHGVVGTFFEVASAEPGAPFRNMMSRPAGRDPPDCEALDAQGRRLGIEVTELVDERAIQQSRHDPRFWAATWDAGKLIQMLEERLRAKDRPATVHGGPYDEYWLVVHCDEALLSIANVREWLAGHVFARPMLLTRAYLLLSYDPSVQTYPYVRLI